MKHLLLLMAILFGSIGCQRGNGKDSKPNEKLKTNINLNSRPQEDRSSLKISKRRKVALDKDLTNVSSFKENINNFMVTIEAVTGDYSGSTVECQIKNSLTSQKEKIFSHFDELGLKAELELSMDNSGRSSVDYICRVLDRGYELDAVEIKLKKSIIIPSGKKQGLMALGLADSKNIETLFLEEGSILVTDGEFIHLKMSEFISLDGTIATYAKDNMPVTIDNEPGKSGGVIHIETEKALGEVSFELRGTHAGLQSQQPPQNSFIHPQAPNGQCRGKVSMDNFSAKNKLCWGKNGLQGQKGLKGLNGLNGGDSGSLVFKAQKIHKLKIKVGYFPGKESKGSIGGAAGIPGIGGIGSTIEIQREHVDRDHVERFKMMGQSGKKYKYPDGQIGIKGEQGDMGDPGTPGKNETSKISFNSDDMIYEFDYDFKNY
jgi:hypothetical protein